MNIYFYCSYQQSKRGFFLTRLDHGSLKPVPAEPVERYDKLAYEFFSYDYFQVLWRHHAENENALFVYKPAFSFLGIREMKGTISERSGVCGMALIAQADKSGLLQEILFRYLANYRLFSNKVLGFITADEKAGYLLDAEGFLPWLMKEPDKGTWQLCYETPQLKRIQMILSKKPMGIVGQKMPNFAVCRSWNTAAEAIGKRLFKNVKPPFILEQEEFEELFPKGETVFEKR